MLRMVFCPGHDSTAEAEELSKKEMLPVLMGDSHRTKELVFDRTRVSVISVPDTHTVWMESPFTTAGLVQAVNYVNDYADLVEGDARMLVTGPEGDKTEVLPMVKENHYCRFLVRTTLPGEYNAEIVSGGESVFFTRFEARP